MSANNLDYLNNLSDNEILSLAMEKQPVLNIGMIGHVSNGKSTLTKSLTKTVTQKHKAELIRNITIRLGYANSKIFKCPQCDPPDCYQCVQPTTITHQCIHCSSPSKLVMHTSHVDCPGHHDLMTVMLNGTAVMDYTILVESCGNSENFPAPQTLEHYTITNTIGIKPALAVLNKADTMANNKEKIVSMIDKLKNLMFLNQGENTNGNIPIIPISASLGGNIEFVSEVLANLELPPKNFKDNFKMIVIRSFNVNHPGTKISHLKGGVLGGSITRGIMKCGDTGYIYPGFIIPVENPKDQEIRYKYSPLKCKVLSINSDKNQLDFAISGGLIGVQLDIDPGMTCNDSLVGQVMFKESNDMSNAKVFEILKISHNKLSKEIFIDEDGKIQYEMKTGETVSINVNSNNISCRVIVKKSKYINLLLETPICAEIGDRVTLNVFVGNKPVIYGYGLILDGAESEKI